MYMLLLSEKISYLGLDLLHYKQRPPALKNIPQHVDHFIWSNINSFEQHRWNYFQNNCMKRPNEISIYFENMTSGTVSIFEVYV